VIKNKSLHAFFITEIDDFPQNCKTQNNPFNPSYNQTPYSIITQYEWYKMFKTGILLNARLQSTRLPKKHLRLVNHRPIFFYLIDRIYNEFENEIKNNEISIIITTSDILENREFEKFHKKGVDVFYGAINNIPLRHKQVAKKCNLDFIISVDGDDIFSSIDGMRKVYEGLQGGEKYVKTVNLPLGMNVNGYSSQLLAQSLNGYEDIPLEMGWGRIFDENKLKSIFLNFVYPSSVPSELLRFTLDYEEDFEFFQKVIESLGENINVLSDQEIVDFVVKNKFYTINEPVAIIYWNNFNRLVKNEIIQGVTK
jgi:spore coat polysaccharide biosynthesis protein SpsF